MRTYCLVYYVLMFASMMGIGCSGEANPAQALPEDRCDPATPAICLYEPAEMFAYDTKTRTVVDNQSICGPRTFEVVFRMPQNTVGPRPIVIWTHGGSDGKANALNSGPNWGVAFAEAGYVAVNVAHPDRDMAGLVAICSHLGYPSAATCASEFRSLNWDRPSDLIRVLDLLEELAQTSEFAGRLDLEHIAVAGHSAGLGGTAQLAGAPRVFNSVPYFFTDARADAFLFLSPAANSRTFPEGAWTDLRGPSLSATGSNDTNESHTPEDRLAPFQTMPPGDNYLLFFDHPGSRHTLFNLETTACLRETDQATCNALRDWLRSTALAFVDAYLSDRAEAKAWLASQSIVTASDGIASWETR